MQIFYLSLLQTHLIENQCDRLIESDTDEPSQEGRAGKDRNIQNKTSNFLICVRHKHADQPD